MSLVYTPALVSFLKAEINLSSADVRAILVKSSYVVDRAHQFLNQIAAGDRIGSAVALTSEAVTTDGAFDAANPTFTSVAAGSEIAGVVLYVHTGTESTSRLLAFINSAIGFPRPTNGGNVTIEWSNDIDRIFRLISRT